jgi:peptidoglycan/LPS O-acetylase OafA/YrhL
MSLQTHSSSARLPQLDGLRGIAIILVLIWHYGVCCIKSSPNLFSHQFIDIFNLTWSGVDLFFVLSGFLLGGILMDHKGAANYFQVFYFRRICRIFPLYFFWLILFIGIWSFLKNLVSQEALHVLLGYPLPFWSYLTFTQNILMAADGDFGSRFLGITWSLAVEEQFYLLLPLIIYLTPKKKITFILLLFIVLAPLSRSLLYYFQIYPGKGFASYVMTPCRLDSLFLGVLCAHIIRQDKLTTLLRNNLKYLYFFLVLMMIVFYVMTVNNQLMLSQEMTLYGYTLIAVFYAVLLLISVLKDKGVLYTILTNPLLRKMGRIAYGVYIYHIGVLATTYFIFSKGAFEHYSLLLNTVSLFFTLIIAQLSWILFEKRINNFGHSIEYSPPFKKE